MEPAIHRIGIVHEKINDIEIQVYDRERTMCDLLRHSGKIDPEILNKAILFYMEDNRMNILALIDYANRMRVYSRVKHRLRVWW